MRKFNIKVRYQHCFLALGGLVGVFIILNLYVNHSLNRSKPKLIEVLVRHLEYPISIEDIYYAFPNKINIERASLGLEETSDVTWLEFPKVVVDFDLKAYLTKRKFLIQKLSFESPRLDSEEHLPLLTQGINNIIQYIRTLPRSGLGIDVYKADIPIKNKSKVKEILLVSMSIRTNKDTFFSLGSIEQRDEILNNNQLQIMPKTWLQYSTEGSIEDYGFVFKRIDIHSNNWKTTLWADLQGADVSIKGYASIGDEFLNDQNANQKAQTFPMDAKYQVFDIDGKLKLADKAVHIERFDFIFDGIPVQMQGHFSNQHDLDFQLKLESFPSQSKFSSFANVQRAGFELSGALAKKQIKTDGKLFLDFSKNVIGSVPADEFELAFKNLWIDLARSPDVPIQVDWLRILEKKSESKLLFTQVQCLLNSKKNKETALSFQSDFYGGKILAKLDADTRIQPVKMSTMLEIKAADLSAIDLAMFNFSHLTGTLSSQMYYENLAGHKLSADITIEKGTLRQNDYLNWLALYFDLPSLKSLDFDRAFLGLSLQDNELRFNEIDLISRNLQLKGFFNVNHQNLVASKFSLAFNRQLLGESAYFRSLLRRINQDTDHLVFDFQLSGRLNAMNFYWLNSDLKEEIEDNIPKFIQRMIQEKIDRSI